MRCCYNANRDVVNTTNVLGQCHIPNAKKKRSTVADKIVQNIIASNLEKFLSKGTIHNGVQVNKAGSSVFGRTNNSA